MSVSIYVGQGSEDDLNLSNTNFVRLMDLLGVDIDPDNLYGSFEGAALLDLRDRVLFALESVRAMPALDGGRQDVEWVTASGGRIIECGLSAGYFEDRLTRLAGVVLAAIVNGEAVQYA